MTQRDGSNALAKAIYTSLSAANVGASVFDHVPESQARPYVEVGDIQTEDWGTKDTDGTEHVAEIHVYTGERGRKTCRDIMLAIHDALHHQTLTVEGNQTVLVHFDSSEVERESDGLTYHGVTRFRVLLNYTG